MAILQVRTPKNYVAKATNEFLQLVWEDSRDIKEIIQETMDRKSTPRFEKELADIFNCKSIWVFSPNLYVWTATPNVFASQLLYQRQLEKKDVLIIRFTGANNPKFNRQKKSITDDEKCRLKNENIKKK